MSRESTGGKVFEAILGCLLIASLVCFFGGIYYYCEAYPKVWSAEQIDATHAKVVLFLGSMCDPPQKYVDDLARANPQIEIEGWKIGHAWNGDKELEIRFKVRDK